jgi:hypothetical protein
MADDWHAAQVAIDTDATSAPEGGDRSEGD